MLGSCSIEFRMEYGRTLPMTPDIYLLLLFSISFNFINPLHKFLDVFRYFLQKAIKGGGREEG